MSQQTDTTTSNKPTPILFNTENTISAQTTLNQNQTSVNTTNNAPPLIIVPNLILVNNAPSLIIVPKHIPEQTTALTTANLDDTETIQERSPLLTMLSDHNSMFDCFFAFI